MQIVKSDGQYRVYGENIEVYDKLDPDVNADKQQ